MRCLDINWKVFIQSLSNLAGLLIGWVLRKFSIFGSVAKVTLCCQPVNQMNIALIWEVDICKYTTRTTKLLGGGLLIGWVLRKFSIFGSVAKVTLCCQPVNQMNIALIWKVDICKYTTRTTKLLGGILVSLRPSVRLSVRPSVRPASRVRSVAPTVLVGSISYLYILSSNFRRYVACKVSGKFSKFVFLAFF